jgi:hypothetical protein
MRRVRSSLQDPDVARAVETAKRGTQREALLQSGVAHDDVAPARSRSAPSRPRPRDGAGKRGGTGTAEDELMQQEIIVREQDQSLDDLAVAVRRIGDMGKEMHEELEQHSVLLDDTEVGMDNTSSRMRSVHRKLDEFMAETSRGQLCTIVSLFFLFILLTFLFIAT